MTNDFELMAKKICPVCREPMMKNGKRTHSKQKAKICLEMMRKRHGIKPPQIEVDGKLYDVNLSMGEKKE